MRKVIVISGIILLVAAAAFLGIKYFPVKSEYPDIQTFSTKQNPAFKAVPQKSPLVIEVKNQEGFFSALQGEHSVFAQFKGIQEFDDLFSTISRFRDFVGSHSGLSKLLKSKSIIISVNPTGKNQLTNLYLVQLNNQDESNSAAQIVSLDLGPAYTITKKNYENTTIFNVKSADLNFYFACANDIFIASEDFILIEDAIRHSNSQNLLGNHEFTEVYKTIEETAMVNIFINHLTIHQILTKLVSPEIKKTIIQMASYSNWTELDLSVNAAEMEFNGYSVTKDSSDNYLNAFRDQEAQKMTIDNVIPANASFFVALNLKNTSNFLDQYESFIKANGQYYPREKCLIEFRKKTNTEAVKLMKEIAGNQFAGVYTNINKSNPSQNRFFVAELTSQSDAEDRFGKAVAEFGRSTKGGPDKLHTEYVADSKNTFDIYRLPISNMAESLFGRAFSDINGEYFVVYEKYLIWGDNLPGLKNYLQSLVTGKTMANDSIYQVYQKGAQSNPNFSLYAKIPKIFRLKEQFFKPEIAAMLSENEDIIRKYSAFSWQFSVSDNMIKNRINLKYDPNVKEEPQAVWQLKLEAPLAQRPKLVLNHRDIPNRELIVRDKLNNVYLISKDGLILWTVNILGEIISDIHQIDIYRNNKYQYLFNTKTQLFVIDRTGSKVGKYPVTLKSIASNAVSVAEYGKNKEYRFLIAGEDHKIYVFDRDGKLVPQWSFEGAENSVSEPIQYMVVDDKDYIVFSDQQNTYFLNRQGKSRELEPAKFDHSGNPVYFINEGNPGLISTDQSGRIHIQDFTGQAEIREVGKFGAGHRFLAQDLDGNGSPEYIFAENKKLSVFAPDGKKIFDHSFPDMISEIPVIYSYSPGINKIGVVVGDDKIYLLDKKGGVMRGFPLYGNTGFVVGKFNDANGWNNLVVGGESNMLINYRIEL